MGNAIIWDSNIPGGETNGVLFYEFMDSLAWANKVNWIQVPYGTIAYTFIGDPIIENGNFWLFLQSSRQNSPLLYANINGVPGEIAELYGTSNVSGTWKENMYPRSRTIVKNQPDEVIIIQDAGSIVGENITRFRVKANTNWLEEVPGTSNPYLYGIHSSPQRFAASPPPNETNADMVIDAQNNADGQYPIPEANKYGIQEVFNRYGQYLAYMVIPKDMPSSDAYINVYTNSSGSRRLETIRSRSQLSIANSATYIGIINQLNVFKHEVPNIAIASGGSYTASFKPAIAGKWRVSGRVNGVYYTQTRDVQAGGNLVFTSPVSGTLQAMAMYLYDRNSSTPSDVATPQDIYRQVSGPCIPNWQCEYPPNGYESDGCGNRRLNAACNSTCVPNWQCEIPLNGYEFDGCGNRRLNSACNSGCIPNWQCEYPLNGYEVDGCGNRRANSACNPVSCIPNWQCEIPLNGFESDGCGNRRSNPTCNPTQEFRLTPEMIYVGLAAVLVMALLKR